MQIAIKAINELAAEAGKPKWSWIAPEPNKELQSAVSGFAETAVAAAYTLTEKMERYAKIKEVKAAAVEALAKGETPKFTAEQVGAEFSNLEYRLVRGKILDGQPRIDGRDTKTVRAINIRTGVLARTHGSALFTRGETQALVVTTLGTGRDAQIIDGLMGEKKEPFMLHYNFPPFSVGETGMMGSPKRREIGHGNLAKRGVKAVMPGVEKFPYVIRVVSEILESHRRFVRGDETGTRADLSGANLSRVNLERENLDLVDFHGANLEGANLHEARLSSANLSKAKLRRADMRKADLTEADLSDADLTEAKVGGAELFRTDLRRAILRGANFVASNFRLAEIRGADFTGADLKTTVLRETDLEGVNLSGLDLSTTLLPRGYKPPDTAKS